MDPLSIAASVAGFISLSIQTVEIVNDIRSASKEYKIFANRFATLQKSLESIETRIREVAEFEKEIAQGPFGHQRTNNKLFKRYHEATVQNADGSGGWYVQAKKCLDELFNSEFKTALKKRQRWYWTLKKGEVRENLDGAIEVVRFLRDFLYDDDIQLSQASYVEQMKNRRAAEEDKIVQIMEWISPLAHQPTDVVASKHSSVLPIPDPFVTSDPVYDQWVNDADSSHWQLNCFGGPGAGKSHRARTVIHNLSGRFEANGDPVLFVLFNQANESQQSLRHVYRRLLRQLLSQRLANGVPESVQIMWNSGRLAGQDGPTELQAKATLITELQKYDRKFIVADALDEATGCMRTIHSALSELRRQAGAAIFSTTRQDPTENHEMTIVCHNCRDPVEDLCWSCRQCAGALGDGIDLCRECYRNRGVRCDDVSHVMRITERVDIKVQPTAKEIEAFVRESLKKELDMDDSDGGDPRLYSGFTVDLVQIRKHLGKDWDRVPGLVSRSAGQSYLVADLIVKRLKQQKNIQGAKVIMSSLEAGNSVGYDDQYHDMLDFCLSRRKGQDRDIAYDHFALVACAQDVLSFAQLSHAVAIQLGDSLLEDFADRFHSQQNVRRATNGLLMIGDFGNPEHETVLFFHRTLADYLTTNKDMWFPDADQKMFNACLAYLRLDIFKKPFKQSKELDRVLEEYPFASYAASFWGKHFRRLPQAKPGYRDENTIQLLELFNDRDRKTAIIQISLHVLSNAELAWDVQQDVSPLHICAFHGLTEVCKLLVDNGECVDCLEESYGQTALHYACRGGHVDTVKVLLAGHANANIASDKLRTPLMEAIEHDHMKVVDILLEYTSTEVNADDGGDVKHTALTFAASRRKTSFVARLLQHNDIKVNKRGGLGRTALTWAVCTANVTCAEVLLQHPLIDVTITDNRIGRALDYIAWVTGPDEAIVNLFLDRDDVPVLERTTLQYLIEDGRNRLVEMFLERQSYVDWKDSHGRSLMHIAATCGTDVRTLELVHDHLSGSISKPCDIEDQFECTPLHAACSRFGTDNGAMAARLLELGANHEARNKLDEMPIDIAYQSVQEASRDAVSFLFSPYFGKRMNTVNKSPAVPLSRIVAAGDINRLEAALKLEPDPLRSIPDPYTGWTVLHSTLYMEPKPRPDILEKLLTKSLPYLDEVSDAGRTCLHVAAEKGIEPAIELLINAGAELNIKDNCGDTAFDLAQRGHPSSAFLLISAGANVRKEKIRKDLIHHAVSASDVDVVQKLVDIGVDVYHQKNGTGPTALGLAKDLYRKAVDDAKIKLATDKTNRQTFPDVLSYRKAVEDDPKVKVFRNILDSLQLARRDESRGRFLHHDFSRLIETLKQEAQSGSSTPVPVPNYVKRMHSEQSPPPPYSLPGSRRGSGQETYKQRNGSFAPLGTLTAVTNHPNFQLSSVEKDNNADGTDRSVTIIEVLVAVISVVVVFGVVLIAVMLKRIGDMMQMVEASRL